MKFIKYIAAALLLTAALTSCETGVEGTPGQTTVQFASAVVQDGFGAGYVYVPLTIVSDSEAGMNSCDVQAKVKVVVTGEEFEGAHDVDGNGGDYSVTSLDVNFPPYDKYYDKKEPKKYFNEELQKWVKEVYMEVKILNSEVDELRFSFEIESATTTVGEQKQCRVVLQKSTRDRLCGLWQVTYDEEYWINPDQPIYWADTEYAGYFPATLSTYDFTMAEIMWDSEYQCFVIGSDHFWTYMFGAPLYAYYDDSEGKGNEKMYLIPHDYLGYVFDPEQSLVQSVWDAEANDWVKENVYFDFNVSAGTLTLPANLGLSISVFSAKTGNLYSDTYLSEAFPTYQGLVFTKVQ